MATFPLIKGTKIRFTKVNSCGLPIAGPANMLVTSGFASVSVTPVMKDRQELEQVNAEGKVCVSDTTPATRKYFTIEVELCNVNTGAITMANGWPQVLDFDSIPIGFRDLPDVDGDYGLAIEVWTGGRADDDCPAPTTDAIFANASSGKKHGYLLIAGTEWQMDAIKIGPEVSTVKLTGISIAIPQWAKGPYNVQEIDSDGTPGRLIDPMNDKSHYSLFRTGVTPPDSTPGDGPCELAIADIFTDPDFYFGGPAGEPAADIAPPQPICGGVTYHVEVDGTGNFSLKVGSEETTDLAVAALPAAVQAALEALLAVAPGQVQVTGTAGDYTITLDSSLGVLTAGATAPTGGTVTVTLVP